MFTSIDCRGLACPAPVLQTKERIEQARPAKITVRLDNEAAVENVSRFLKSQGYSIAVSHEDHEYVKNLEVDSFFVSLIWDFFGRMRGPL